MPTRAELGAKVGGIGEMAIKWGKWERNCPTYRLVRVPCGGDREIRGRETLAVANCLVSWGKCSIRGRGSFATAKDF